MPVHVPRERRFGSLWVDKNMEDRTCGSSYRTERYRRIRVDEMDDVEARRRLLIVEGIEEMRERSRRMRRAGRSECRGRRTTSGGGV